MMNVSKFLQEGAKYMAADRPDIWDTDLAFEVLSGLFAHLAGEDGSGEIRTGGFTLQKYVDSSDGVIEYNLSRQILSFDIFEDENETSVTNWINCSALTNIGLDIPDLFHPDLDTDD